MKLKINKKEFIAVILLLQTNITSYSFYHFWGGINSLINFAPNLCCLGLMLWGLSKGMQKSKTTMQIMIFGTGAVLLATCYTLILWLFNPVDFRSFTRLVSTDLSYFLLAGASAAVVYIFKERCPGNPV